MFPCFFPHLAGTSNLFRDDARCGGEFRTTFRTIPRSRGDGVNLEDVDDGAGELMHESTT